MSASDTIRRLGELYGIEPSYTDFWGQRRRVPAATERALLEAMGVAVGSEREVADRLREAEARPWRRMLAPVRVLAPPEPREITFTLPARLGGATVDWTLSEEGGQVHEGRLRPDELPAVASGEGNGESYRRWRMPLPADLPHGYHRLAMAAPGHFAARGAMQLVIAPARCYGPGRNARLWGLTAQLYGVRSERNWGMGDFTDLADLTERAAALGASAVGVNPLHALFPADASHFSPYSPSSRLFLNVFYLDPEAVPDLAESSEAQAILGDAAFRIELEETRAAELVDYPAVWRLKLRVLEQLFASFQNRHLAASTKRAAAFGAYRAEMGGALEQQAVFDALHEHALRTTGTWSWQQWPEPLRHPDSPKVAEFARERQDRVDFFAYLQWQADEQLAGAQARARAAGMALGLYNDIAIGVGPASATAWANPGISLSGVGVGAPPDLFNLNGQNWGLAPLSPAGLRESAYALFAAALRHNMRHSGAVRIDHVMGLQRLFWIPDGASPADGAYVRYPFADLAHIIALESERHRCLVIGEDLGNVPRGFRPAMQRVGMMSCRVLYFERDEGRAFVPPEAYPRQALVSVSTHDLPTIRGFWTRRDLQWRDLLRRFPDEAAFEGAHAERDRDRVMLLKALRRADMLPAGIDPEQPPDEPSDELVLAVHRYLAMTPGHLLMVQLEDALGEVEQPNLPGVEEHPNWRRKLGRSLEALADEPLVAGIAEVMAAAGRSFRR
ncbi:MAG TPA: 4-alpha-glucanotransferase [Geminicoccaceae bacterium]